jgi:putative aminopeptidase FrvX
MKEENVRDESRAFLNRLLEAAGPSNYEVEAARAWRAEAEGFCAEVTTDVNGNTIARLHTDAPAGAKKVLLCGHIDEIGLIVTHINDDGTLAFRGIGGWDPQVLVGQRIRVLARGGKVTGISGRKAAHLLRGDERDRAVMLADLWIDIGAATKEDAATRVRVGDAAVIDVAPIMLTDDLIASRALDDRCCAFIALEALRLLSEGEPLRCDVYAAATVQEEITFRGAHTVAATIAPDVAIALDVTHASDRPGVSPQEVGAHACGSGAAINRGSVSNELLVDLLITTAEREGLPHTLEAGGRSTGTDADALVVTGKGTAGGVISVPCRYMHSPVEVVSLTDLETCAKLLAATIRAIGPETSFIPE